MAAFDYARTAQTSARLLGRFGHEIVFKRKEPGVYNQATSKVDYGYLGERWSEVAVQVVVLQYDLVNVDGTLIKMTDSRVLLSPSLGFEPTQGDVLMLPVFEFGSLVGYEEYEVIATQTIAPAGVVVLYEVQARKD